MGSTPARSFSTKYRMAARTLQGLYAAAAASICFAVASATYTSAPTQLRQLAGSVCQFDIAAMHTYIGQTWHAPALYMQSMIVATLVRHTVRVSLAVSR